MDDFPITIVKSIARIWNKKTKEEIEIAGLSAERDVDGRIWRVKLATGLYLSRKMPCEVTYTCVRCGRIHSLGLAQLLRKLNATQKPGCPTCLALEPQQPKPQQNQEQEQDKDQEDIKIEEKVCITKIDTREFRLKSIQDFEVQFSTPLKSMYYQYHMTGEEYDRVKPWFIGAPRDMEYWPVVKSQTHTLFTSMFYFPNSDKLLPPVNLTLKCHACTANFAVQTLHSMKNWEQPLCKTCRPNSDIMKLQRLQNKNGDAVHFVNSGQKKLIRWCGDSGLLIVNGQENEYDVFDDSRPNEPRQLVGTVPVCTDLNWRRLIAACVTIAEELHIVLTEPVEKVKVKVKVKVEPKPKPPGRSKFAAKRNQDRNQN